MRTRFIAAVAAVGLAGLLAGCQTPQESAADAHMTCEAQGLHPGTGRYRRCMDATYAANRERSAQAENAAAAGVAAGVIGGAIIGTAAADGGYYYHGGYYGHCNAWRCW